MGWNELDEVRPSRLLKGLPQRPHLYFAHSYYVPVVDQAAAAYAYSFRTLRFSNREIHSGCNAIRRNPDRSACRSSATSWSSNKMLAKRIIPCLDVTAGRVVKGVNFVNLRDAGDPVELADRYNQQGADELVFLDITASSDVREIMANVVARTARQVFIHHSHRRAAAARTVADARLILMSGADKVSVNTAAVRRPEVITELSNEFGAQAVVTGRKSDARRHAHGKWHTFSRKADESMKESTLLNGPPVVKPSAQEKSC